MTILLTGGTGTLGRHVTPLLLATGAKVRLLSRQAKESTDGIEYVTGDLLGGTGIAEAVDGVETILHLAGDAKTDDVTTRNLVEAAQRAGVRHIVYISVTATDRIPLGYFRAKLAAEQIIIESGIPHTILRAAQFHDFTLNIIRMLAKLPVVPKLKVRFQPVETTEVAARLVELTLAEPAGRVPDLVGPAVLDIGDLTRDYLKATGKRRLMIPVRIPGKGGRVYRTGANLVVDGVDFGTRTWEDFLAEQLS